MLLKHQEHKKAPDFWGISAVLIHESAYVVVKKHCSRKKFLECVTYCH